VSTRTYMVGRIPRAISLGETCRAHIPIYLCCNEVYPMSEAIHEAEDITAKFSEFFPPDDPDSTWLFRLMILRDDVHHNRAKLRVKDDAGAEEVWELTYCLRMLSVSLVEANSIFAHKLGQFAKRPPDDVAKKMAPLLQSGIAKLKAVVEPLKTLRDALGGHVRPQNVGTTEVDVVAQVITNHPELAGTVRIGGLPETVSYRGLTLNSILFAWPDVDVIFPRQRGQGHYAAKAADCARNSNSMGLT
jgi:hypothetical protein